MQDFENLGDNVDYSDRFVTDREFISLNELHTWADEIAITRVSVYLRCHRYGKIRGNLQNLIILVDLLVKVVVVVVNF